MRPLHGRTLSALSLEKRAEAGLKVRLSAVPSIKRSGKKAKMFDPRAIRGVAEETRDEKVRLLRGELPR